MTDQISEEEALTEAQQAHRAMFQALLEQDADVFQAGGPWPEDDEGRQRLIGEVQDVVVTFIMARLQRYSELSGTPKNVEFRLQVRVEGDESRAGLAVAKSKLILPNQ